jgi:hypothetical protein
MPFARKTFTIIIVIYWVLLMYIMAALVWWFISLENQNREMTELRLKLELPDNPDYNRLVSRSIRP